MGVRGCFKCGMLLKKCPSRASEGGDRLLCISDVWEKEVQISLT